MKRPGRRLLTALLRPFTDGLRVLRDGRKRDAEVDEEVAHFMAEAEADLVASGATPDEARRQVRLQYGDPLVAREQVRSYGWESMVRDLVQDLALTLRRLRRSPTFTTAAVATLALGIGAATAMLTVTRPVLFDPLPYPQAERLVAVSDRGEDGAALPVAFGTHLEIAERTRSLEAQAVHQAWTPTLTERGPARRLVGSRVSAAFFDVLGVAPHIGPGFTPSEDRPGGLRQVILSHEAWTSSFASDSSIVGTTVRLDGDAHDVVGVMPQGFVDATRTQARLWGLLQYDPTPTSHETREWGQHLGLIARLAPGTERAVAGAELDRIASSPVALFPRPPHADLGRGLDLRSLQERTTAGIRPTMLLLLGGACLLLLIAGVNVSMLVLGRSARQSGELALRRALGAGRGRLSRYLGLETVTLALMGSLGGFVVARALLIGLQRLDGVVPTISSWLGVDPLSLAVAALAASAIGLVPGLLPVWSGRAQALSMSVRSRFSALSASTRQALVVGEAALSVALLLAAGLLVRSTLQVLAVPAGFESDGRLVMQIHATGLGDDAAIEAFFASVVREVEDMPGVADASLTTQLPLSGDAEQYGVARAGGSAPTPVGAAYRYVVSPDHLDNLNIGLVRGRTLEATDDGASARVALVSRSLARRAFGEGEAIGSRIHVGPTGGEPFTVVGVVDDVKQPSLTTEGDEAVYIGSAQWHWADPVRWLVVRGSATSEGGRLAQSVQRGVRSIDEDRPITGVAPYPELVRRSEGQRRLAMLTLAGFAGAALLLVGVGIYGVVAAGVSGRAWELSVRAALGASPEDLRGKVVRQGVLLSAVGVVLGLVGAALLTRTADGMLFGVSRHDALTHLVVVAIMLALAALASWIPARRAARVDPASCLRGDS